jgi:exodeoxyribonuclease VII large subunit
MPGDTSQDIIFGVSDFVAVLNQTMEYAFQGVVVTGELANFRVSKGKWVYFDLKDDFSSVKCFGTIYMLPGPLEDGMVLNVRAVPRLHQLYGFSLNISSIQPVGEGTIRRASELLQAKLAAEGLFDENRKRSLPYPPSRIGLVASGESAAYVDFMKILNARWGGIEVVHADVQVQGEVAPGQIVAAIEQLNGLAEPPEAIIVTRGGGSAEDLQAFSTEQVTRAVAASRVPTLVAIGHEVDMSLAELAADTRASTPSNAAELLVPDRTQVLYSLRESRKQLDRGLMDMIMERKRLLQQFRSDMEQYITHFIKQKRTNLTASAQLLHALSPQAILERGYAMICKNGKLVRRVRELAEHDTIQIVLSDGSTSAVVDRKG